MRKVFLFVFIIFVQFSVTAYADLKPAIQEANEKFAYNGKPIHPGLIQEFSSWISDSGEPTTISVDVAANHRNEYFEDDMKIRDNGVIVLQKEGEQEYFYYKWLGRLNNGLHVLSVGEGGGGSGVFQDLFFVRFDIGNGFTSEGERYERLLMTIVRSFILGDRDDAEIKVLPDQVVIGKSQYRDDPVIIKADEMKE